MIWVLERHSYLLEVNFILHVPERGGGLRKLRVTPFTALANQSKLILAALTRMRIWSAPVSGSGYSIKCSSVMPLEHASMAGIVAGSLMFFSSQPCIQERSRYVAGL
jgi:hypothetical protein